MGEEGVGAGYYAVLCGWYIDVVHTVVLQPVDHGTPAAGTLALVIFVALLVVVVIVVVVVGGGIVVGVVSGDTRRNQ